mgnify:CR=1 FL=1
MLPISSSQFSSPKKRSGHHFHAVIQQQKDRIHSLTHQLDVCRILSDEAADAICTIDLRGKLTYANKAQAQLVKVPLQKIQGTHFRRYVDSASLTKAYKFFQMAKSGQRIYDELNIVDSKGNVIPVDFHTTPLYKQGKVYAIHTIVRDIRKRKQLEQLQIESAKMHAMSCFIAGMAKEIKYPLEVIANRLQDISHSYKNRDFEYIWYKEFKHIMTAIENLTQQVKYCHNMTNRMIHLNRKDLKTTQPACDVNEAIHKAIDLIDGKFLRDHTKITLKLAARLPQAAISKVEFTQVMVNILTNAIEAMPTGGIVTVKTRYNKDKKRIFVQIHDQGIGIKKENLTHIFEPFFTTKQFGVEKSSGLGLAIVSSIIHAYQGSIAVSTNLRQGTIFTIELPPISRK